MDPPLTIARLGLFALLGAWLVAAAAVWGWGVKYGFTTNTPPSHALSEGWPSETRVARDPGRPTLMLFLHPRCPCSRATLAELEGVVHDPRVATGNPPQLVTVATIPPGATSAWTDSSLVKRAERLPGMELLWDEEGVEAARFGAVSSGTVMLFDQQGRKCFAGGITAARGHEGDNTGQDQLIEALLHQGETNLRTTPVFGCRLCWPTTDPPTDESDLRCGESCPLPSETPAL